MIAANSGERLAELLEMLHRSNSDHTRPHQFSGRAQKLKTMPIAGEKDMQ
jgi:hypothetical protein